MKYLRLFEDFYSETEKINIINIDGIKPDKLNKKIETEEYEFGDEIGFQVLAEHLGEKKKIYVEFYLLVEFIKNQDSKLASYLDSQDGSDLDAMEILKDFNWDFAKSIDDYINKSFTPQQFKDLESDLTEWDENDEEDYNDLLGNDEFDDLLDPDDED